MNTEQIQKAIEVIENGNWWLHLDDSIGQDMDDLQEATDTALSALRAQLERMQGCEWCEDTSSLTRHIYKFCPMCGRELEG